MNKTSTNSLIFYFNKAKQKNVCLGYMKNIPKYFVLFRRNNPLMLKGLTSVDIKIIQMYHFRLKWKRYTVCTNWWDSYFFGVGLILFWSGTPTFSSGTPTFCQMGVLNSCFQNPSESSAQGPQCSDAGEARTCGPSVSSQALYHWATALPFLH